MASLTFELRYDQEETTAVVWAREEGVRQRQQQVQRPSGEN